MATSNITVTQDWTQLAATADDPVLVTFSAPVWYEVATTDVDSAPSGIIGHQVDWESGFTRDVVGSGYIWVRVVDSPETITSVTAIVTK